MRTGYRFGAARLAVDSDDADALRWLDEFVAPWFERCAALATDRVVHYGIADAAVDARTRELATATRETLPCFALDRDVVMLPGRREGGVAQAVDAELGATYQVTPGRIDVLGRAGMPRARIALMRVVREVLVTAAQAALPRLDLHAAALATAAGAVLLAGPKRAGKTTLLADLIDGGAAALIANDRVLVDAQRVPPVAFGVPTLVAIRPGTLELHPGLRRTPAERPAIFHSGEAARESPYDGSAGTRRDFSLTPGQLAARCGTRTLAGASIAAIVFPEVDPRATGRSLAPLAVAEGTARLLDARYGPRGATRARTIFECAGAADHAQDARSTLDVQRLAAAVPMYRCVLGAGARDEEAATLLRAVAGTAHYAEDRH